MSVHIVRGNLWRFLLALDAAMLLVAFCTAVFLYPSFGYRASKSGKAGAK